MTQKTIVYQSDWRYHRRLILLGILMIPLYGVGLLLLVAVALKLHSMRYTVDDTSISWHGFPFSRVVRTAKLDEVESVYTVNQQTFRNHSIASVVIKLHSKEMLYIRGIKGAHELTTALNNIIERIRMQAELKKRAASAESTFKPGSMERLNDLVGLWQQGLITDEEYEREKEKFS